MLLSKIKNTFAVFLVLGVLALATAGLLSTTQATEPDGGGQDKQKQAQAKPDDVHQRVLDPKQQLQQMQKKIAQLEDETQPVPSAGDAPDLAKRFKYRVPFELGYTEAKEGGRLDIREVWGTRPKIEIGGQYLVRGKYVLPPGEKGKIYFYVTATGDWGREPTATLDLQAVSVEKQEGEFTLVHGMAGPGYFHLYLADPERYSRTFANVYFGTGDNVLRKMPDRTHTNPPRQRGFGVALADASGYCPTPTRSACEVFASRSLTLRVHVRHQPEALARFCPSASP